MDTPDRPSQPERPDRAAQPERADRGTRLQKNQLVELSVTNLAFGGAGIAKIGDFVVFVTGAVPGDVVRARITKLKRRYAEARAEHIITPSPDRIRHRCSSFGACGGCVWQGLDYSVQLEYKTRQVRESLEHLGGLRDFELLPIARMPDPWRYRNRADFSIGKSVEGAIVGFRPPGRWDAVLPLSECHLLEPGLEQARVTVEKWLREEGLPGWDPRTGTGFARHLLARSAQDGGELLLSVVTIPERLPDADRLVERLRSAHPQLVGVLHAVNGGRAEVSSGLESTLLWGRPYLLETLGGTTLKVSADAFFQTNTAMAEVLYGIAAQDAVPPWIVAQDAVPPWIAAEEVTAGQPEGAGQRAPGAPPLEGGREATEGPIIWDLYSGVGSIALSLARRARAVLGIEAVPAAVKDARENACLNNADNVFFIEGDVAKILREVAEGARQLPEAVAKPDVILVDPPRAGLTDKAISRIAEVAAPRIVYVSCNPATMAPNVARLQDFGYRLERVSPVDMFPHTPHVECVGLLSKDGGA
jgi:23S rRNA (uracil1939-C5)-methyltransferase